LNPQEDAEDAGFARACCLSVVRSVGQQTFTTDNPAVISTAFEIQPEPSSTFQNPGKDFYVLTGILGTKLAYPQGWLRLGSNVNTGVVFTGFERARGVRTEFTVLTTPLHWIQCTWKHRLVAVHAQHAPISIGGLREKLNTENTVYCSGHACESKGISSMLAIDVGWLQFSTAPQPLYWQRASVKHGPIRRPPQPRPPLKVMVTIDQRV